MSVRCRNGHDSADTDYCSVCGVAIEPAPPASVSPAPPPASGSPAPPPGGAACPVCGEPHPDAGARYCEVCRYDFVEQTPGPPPVGVAPVAAGSPATAPPAAASAGEPVAATAAAGAAAAAAAAPTAVPAAEASAPVAGSTVAGSTAPGGIAPAWTAMVSVDPTLDVDPDPSLPCPTGQAEQVFPLDRAEMMIGRRDERRDIHPEIALQDPAASRRHAKLLLQPDGGLAVLDLESANGTSVNGSTITPGTPHPLHGDDVLTLGRWTRIVIRGRQ